MSFDENIERKREIQLLLIGKDMLEASFTIQDHIHMRNEESKENIGKEIIKLIKGAQSYGEVIIEDDSIRAQYLTLLEEAEKDIEVCKIATYDIASLAAKLAISSMKHTAEIIESKILISISIAVAWGADLIRRIAEGEEYIGLKDAGEVIIGRIKAAIDFIMEDMEKITPDIAKDLEWLELKEKIMIQTMIGINKQECVEDEEHFFTSSLSKVMGLIRDRMIGFTRGLRA